MEAIKAMPLFGIVEATITLLEETASFFSLYHWNPYWVDPQGALIESYALLVAPLGSIQLFLLITPDTQTYCVTQIKLMVVSLWLPW